MTVLRSRIETIVMRYFKDADGPSDQPELRSREFYGLKGIVSEIWQWFNEMAREFTDGQLRNLIFQIIRDAERLANERHIAKVTSIEIAEIFQKMSDQVEQLAHL